MEESEARGLFLNSAKSFTMVFSKSEVKPTCKITVHGNTLEQVDRVVYLGSQLQVGDHLNLLSAQYLVQCLDTENVCHHITKMDLPPRTL